MPVNYLIIVAGGTGSRMKNDLPKQFIKVNGKEIILHTIKKFTETLPEIKVIVAVHKNYTDLMAQILNENNIEEIKVIEGGETRFHSVKNALNCITENPNAVVGIHDAARPLVSKQTIINCYETAQKMGNATPAVSVNETIRESINGINKSVNRDNYKIIQTPQCFIVSEIKKAFQLPYNKNFTDDASVLEANGEKINLVEGNVENIKITNPHDLIIVKALLENEQR